MLQIPIDDLKTGMIVGRSLFSPFGELLLAAGYRLRGENIRRLKLLGFPSAWIIQVSHNFGFWASGSRVQSILLRQKTICCPSGENRENQSVLGPLVSCLMSVPSQFIMKIS